MKILSRFSLTLVLLSNTLSASAATVPAAEPDNGFVKGQDVEFSSVHENAPESSVEHRQYHRDAVSDQLDWIEANKDRKELPAYNNEYREYRQIRNWKHRLWHMNLDAEDVIDEEAMEEEVTERDPAGAVVNASRTYEGGRPSRRSIMNDVEQRDREIANSHN